MTIFTIGTIKNIIKDIEVIGKIMITNIIYYIRNLINNIFYINNPFSRSLLLENTNAGDDYYFLILRENSTTPIKINNEFITENTLNNINNNVMLFKPNNNMLKKINIENYTKKIISKENLNQCNIIGYDLREYNKVIFLLSLKFSKFIEYYYSTIHINTLTNILSILAIDDYYNTDTIDINSLLYQNKLFEFKLFKINYVIFKTSFENRKFNLSLKKITETNMIDFINIYIAPNYADDTLSLSPKTFTLIKPDIYSIFLEDMIEDITENKFNDMLFKLPPDIILNISIKLLTSFNYSHLIIKNIKLMKFINSAIVDVIKNKHKMHYEYNELRNSCSRIYEYYIEFIQLSWYIMYTKEQMSKNIYSSDNIIFDLEAASILPRQKYKNSYQYLPYMDLLSTTSYPLLLNTFNTSVEYSNIYNTDESLDKFIENFERNNICNIEEFKYRMNLFCILEDYDIFENIDFNKYKCVVTGSLMTACLQIYHPLMDLFKKSENDDFKDIFKLFLNEYYNTSDIDVMIYGIELNKYINNVKIIYEQIKINIFKHMKYQIDFDLFSEDFELIEIKLANLMISTEYIIKNFKDYDIDDITNNITSDRIKNLFINDYYSEIDKYNKSLRKDLTEEEIKRLTDKYPIIYNHDDRKLSYNVHVINGNKSSIKLSYIYKFHIKSKYLKHNIEMFLVDGDDPMTKVSKFHLPCVRSYYNGNNVYLTPSCISAHLSYINIDYKYFMSNKDILNIFYKNIVRGFGCIFNKSEFLLFNQYIKYFKPWIKSYDSDYKDHDINSVIHKPRIYDNTFSKSGILENYQYSKVIRNKHLKKNINQPTVELKIDDNKRCYIISEYNKYM